MEGILSGIENVPDRARIMRIMANQSPNTVGSIKLPNGCHTQAGIETLKELYRVHFSGATAGETVEIRQGQPNLGTFIAHREDWELSERIIGQSKIKWVIHSNHSNWQEQMRLYLHYCNRESNT